MDSVDVKIIGSLMNEARKPVTQISEETGISRLTVMSRLNKLIGEGLIRACINIDIGKLGFRTAMVALEVKSGLMPEVERRLLGCPRVLMILKLFEKANLSVLLYAENQDSLASTIECIRDLSGSSIVDVHHSSAPLYPGTVSLRVFPEKNSLSPCERKCGDCYRYKNEQCVGCPAVTEYRGPL